MDLAALVAPEHTSLLTMETERGVGDLARFTGPAEAARESGMIDRSRQSPSLSPSGAPDP